jgi:predicted TPR repeat methyltransferase
MPIFRERGCASYTAIDISKAMLDRFRASDVIKICTDLNARFIETITPNHYDAICCFFVLEYITDLEAFF